MKSNGLVKKRMRTQERRGRGRKGMDESNLDEVDGEAHGGVGRKQRERE
jgi:hypothetical protein